MDERVADGDVAEGVPGAELLVCGAVEGTVDDTAGCDVVGAEDWVVTLVVGGDVEDGVEAVADVT